MKLARRLVSIVLLSVSLVLVGGMGATGAAEPKKPKPKQPAQPAKPKPPAAKPAVDDKTLIQELRHAHAVLTAANPIYAGHRGRALKHINDAIDQLQKEIHARGQEDKTAHVRDVPQNVSNALLVQTAHALETVQQQLANPKGTPPRKQAASLVAKAHSEIVLALLYTGNSGPGNTRAAGVWQHSVNAVVKGNNTLFPNGRINKADGNNRWTFDGTHLILMWPNPKAPGGAWFDVTRVSADGRTYLGKNQVGATIAGKKISDARP